MCLCMHECMHSKFMEKHVSNYSKKKPALGITTEVSLKSFHGFAFIYRIEGLTYCLSNFQKYSFTYLFRDRWKNTGDRNKVTSHDSIPKCSYSKGEANAGTSNTLRLVLLASNKATEFHRLLCGHPSATR